MYEIETPAVGFNSTLCITGLLLLTFNNAESQGTACESYCFSLNYINSIRLFYGSNSTYESDYALVSYDLDSVLTKTSQGHLNGMLSILDYFSTHQ